MLSLTSMNTALLLQPVQVLINLIFIPICIIYYDAELLKDPTMFSRTRYMKICFLENNYLNGYIFFC